MFWDACTDINEGKQYVGLFLFSLIKTCVFHILDSQTSKGLCTFKERRKKDKERIGRKFMIQWLTLNLRGLLDVA